MVATWWMSSLLQRTSQMAAVNCIPLSNVPVAGTTNQDTQPALNASAQVEASMLGTGTASIHLVLLFFPL